MLKILDEKVLKTDEEIERLYKNCKYLYLIDSYAKKRHDAAHFQILNTSEDRCRIPAI